MEFKIGYQSVTTFDPWMSMLGRGLLIEVMASLKLVVAERIAVEAIGNAFVVKKVAEVVSTSLVAWVEQVRFD